MATVRIFRPWYRRDATIAEIASGAVVTISRSTPCNGQSALPKNAQSEGEVAHAGFFKEVLMPTFTKLLRTAALSAVLGTVLTVAPLAYAATMGGGSHGGGGFAGGGFHGGGFHGGGFRGGAGFHGGGFHTHLAFHDGFHRGWHGRYGYWQNGVWVDGWSPYCDPNSPLYDLNYCYYGD
jgi:hypothetical protein